MKGPKKIKIKKIWKASLLKPQPIPIHDFINFKKMVGNEILLNLENSVHLRDGELISALMELAKWDKKQEHDWELHSWVKDAFIELDKRIGSLTHKQLI